MLKVVQIVPDERDVRGSDEPAPWFGPAPTALLEGFAALKEQIEIHVISCVRRPLAAPEKLADNIFYHAIPVRGGYRRTLFTEAIHKVRGKIRQINPDIVHGQGTEDYQGICAAFSGYRNCITIHGHMRTVARKLKYRPFPEMMLTALAECIALRKTNAVICNSGYTEQCVGSLNKNKIRIPNAVRSSFFDLRSKRLINDSYSAAEELQSTNQRNKQSTEKPPAPVLLCIGDIIPYKNQIGLMRTLDSFPNIGKMKLLFAGSCRSGDEYSRQFLKEVASRDWCGFAGRLTLSELQEKMIGCAGVIHPTLEESFGLAVAEAQASGVPVVASNVGGIPDLIRDGETGFLFDPENPDDIRGGVARLLHTKNIEKIIKNARVFSEITCHPSEVAGKHFKLYRDMVNCGER